MKVKRSHLLIKGLGFSALLILWGGISCISKKDKQALSTDDLFFDYQVIGKEEDDSLTILIQFLDGKNGDAVAIRPVGQVQFDGEVVTPDSTKMTGFYYELHKSINGFSGKHTIVYTDLKNKQYNEQFNFKPFELIKAPADTVTTEQLRFMFSGVAPGDGLHIILTDTSFESEDDVHLSGSRPADKKAQPDELGVFIPAHFSKLSPGPLKLEFIRETEKRLENPTKEGGRLLISHSISREFFLKE